MEDQIAYKEFYNMLSKFQRPTDTEWENIKEVLCLKACTCNEILIDCRDPILSFAYLHDGAALGFEITDDGPVLERIWKKGDIIFPAEHILAKTASTMRIIFVKNSTVVSIQKPVESWSCQDWPLAPYLNLFVGIELLYHKRIAKAFKRKTALELLVWLKAEYPDLFWELSHERGAQFIGMSSKWYMINKAKIY